MSHVMNFELLIVVVG